MVRMRWSICDARGQRRPCGCTWPSGSRTPTLGAFGETPQVVATLFDPARVMGLDAHALGEVFALTPAEARVAARLADGSSVQAIAADQGTSIYTVRAHVRSLHAKFGVQRTADVMRILRQGEALWARAGA